MGIVSQRIRQHKETYCYLQLAASFWKFGQSTICERHVSLQTIKDMIQYLDKNGFEPSLRDKRLVAINGEILWLMPDWSDMPRVMTVASKKSKG
jgi:hypothetical protein